MKDDELSINILFYFLFFFQGLPINWTFGESLACHLKGQMVYFTFTTNICICGRSWLRADLSLNLTLYERRDFLWRFRTSLISIPFSFYLTIHIHLSPVLSVRFNFHEFKLLRYFYSIYFPSIVLYFISSSLYSI